MRFRTALALVFSLPVAAAAQTPRVVVVKAARMLDVEAGRIVANPMIVIEGDRIKLTAVQSGGLQSVGQPPPANATTLDLGDVTVLPGLMDMHTHLAYDLDREFMGRAVRETAADAALRGARNAALTLRAGFTTVRDVGSPGFAAIALMRAVDRGWVEGPRIFPSGYSLGITGGHCDDTGYAPGILERRPEEGVADGPAEILRAVRYQIKHGAQVIKVCATAGVLSFEASAGAQQYSGEELRVVVEEARRHGLKVAAHAHGAEGIAAAVRAGVASIEHGSMLDDEAIRLMKQNKTYLVPTAYLRRGIDMTVLPPLLRSKAESVFGIASESLKRAIREGVPIAFGTDAAVFPHGDNAREFTVLVESGMTPIEAIRSATIHAADLLGVHDRGVIAAGRLADLIAVPGNPLERIQVLENVRFVMKGGQVFKRP